MSAQHGHEHGPADRTAPLHDSCVADVDAPAFDSAWQRRAFGLAVALSEFRHLPWDSFHQELITSIGTWEAAPDTAGRPSWEYSEHWLAALERSAVAHRLVEAAELGPDVSPGPGPRAAGAAPA